MSSPIMENKIWSKKMPATIKLESRMGGTLDIIRKAKNASKKAAL